MRSEGDSSCSSTNTCPSNKPSSTFGRMLRLREQRQPFRSVSRAAPAANIPSGSAIDGDSLLHNSCMLYPDTFEIVEGALQLDPDSIRRRIKVCSNSPAPKYNQLAREAYTFPINIALKYSANSDIIKLLATAAPDVLSQPDSRNSRASLSVALTCGSSLEIIETLIVMNRATASIEDRHLNLPLHLAARHSASLEVVLCVHAAFPGALKTKNFHGETPLDVAVRNMNCPEEVVNYLRRSTFSHFERSAFKDQGENVSEDVLLGASMTGSKRKQWPEAELDELILKRSGAKKQKNQTQFEPQYPLDDQNSLFTMMMSSSKMS